MGSDSIPALNSADVESTIDAASGGVHQDSIQDRFGVTSHLGKLCPLPRLLGSLCTANC